MLTTHNVPYALQHIRYVFKQQIRRPFCRSQPGNFKEQRTSWVGKPSTVSGNRKRLAGKSPAQQVEVGHFVGVGFSDVLTEPLSSSCRTAPGSPLVSVFADLTMAYADKISGPAEVPPGTRRCRKTGQYTLWLWASRSFFMNLVKRCYTINRHHPFHGAVSNDMKTARRGWGEPNPAGCCCSFYA